MGIFAVTMYSLKEAWIKMQEDVPFEGWDGRMYCVRTDTALTFRANRTQGFIAAYTFTLVLEGCLGIVYNGKELTLSKDDLYIYSPGMSITILSASENYRGICLLVDERLSMETPTVRDMLHIAYLPIVQLREPRITLPVDSAHRLHQRMEDILHYLHLEIGEKMEIAEHLYAAFVLELKSVQEQTVRHTQVPKRMEEVFLDFMALLPQHFALHHDLGFYAGELNMTTTYLSRVVRTVSGRTVLDYVNQFLLMEASFLLRTSKLSIGQISDRLHFADTPSFSKFFSRMKGMSPREYRESSVWIT